MMTDLAHWLAGNLGWVLLFVPANYLAAIVGDRFSTRIRARSDDRLHARVTRAAALLPTAERAAYEREWHAELQHILHGQDARPVVRLWHGQRYARGLRVAAGSIARSNEGRRVPLQRLGGLQPRRLGRAAGRSAFTIAMLPVASLLVIALAIYAVEIVLVAAGAAVVTPVRMVVGGGNPAAVYRRAFRAGMRFAPVSIGVPEGGR